MRTNPGLLVVAAVTAACTAACLGGCTSQIGFSERAGEAYETLKESVKDPYVAPKKFRFLRCQDLAPRLTERLSRRQELETLMDRAGGGMTGSAINAVVYKPEYDSVVSEIKQLQDTLAEKNCPPPAPPAVEVKRDAKTDAKNKPPKQSGDGATANKQ